MSKAILGDYVLACGGDLPCGVLLQRMTHLMTNAKVEIDGYLWYVATRTELMHSTGLTKYKYDQSISKLKEIEFVDVIHTVSLKNGSLRNTGFRVTEKARVTLNKAVNGHPNQATGSPDSQAIGSPGGSGYSGPTHQATKKKSCYESSYKESSYTDEQSSLGKVTSTQIEKAFREEKAKLNSSGFHIKWNARLQATAKNFMKAVGTNRSEEVLRSCVSEWGPFVEFAKKSTKMSIPEQPNIHSLLTHAEAALNFSIERKTKGVNVAGMKKLSDW